ncbi:hypothetical protein CsSME_00053209 [Camellia sinensis var. sinensis]
MNIHMSTTSFTKPYQQTTRFTERYFERNVEPLSSAMLYRSQAGRKAKPHALSHHILPVTSRKDTNPYPNIIIHQFLIIFINFIL